MSRVLVINQALRTASLVHSAEFLLQYQPREPNWLRGSVNQIDRSTDPVMRIWKGNIVHIDFMATVFTAWDYDLSFLELAAFLASVVAIGLAIYGPRKTWHWWNISSALYGLLFLQEKYYASAALQLVFIAGGIWGWFGWGASGALPSRLKAKERALWFLSFLIAWVALYPILKRIGAAASFTEAFGFVGSCVAQAWMVLQKYEAWPLWLVVDAVYTYQFFHGGYYLTSLLYLLFVGLAIAGWRRWQQQASQSATQET